MKRGKSIGLAVALCALGAASAPCAPVESQGSPEALPGSIKAGQHGASISAPKAGLGPDVLPPSAVPVAQPAGQADAAPAEARPEAASEETAAGALAQKAEQDARFDGSGKPTPAAVSAGGGLDGWIDEEQARAIQWMEDNISAPGTALGSVMASPQAANPNYRYDWVRDGGLTMKVIANLYRKAVIAGDAVAKDKWFNVLMNYARLSRERQQLQTIAGLGEPKFELDNRPFNDSWGRPQNDSPAARAVALAHFAETLLMEGREELARELLYRKEMPAQTVVKIDLEYIAHHWRDKSFDAWEEVYAQSHFYNLMLIRRALIDGAKLARKLGDGGAAHFYEEQAVLMEPAIEKHWVEEEGIVPSLDERGQPGQDGGLDYKHEHMDSIVFFGVNRGYAGDGFFGPTDDRLLFELRRQESRYKRLYAINQKPDIPGLGIGRYPEDRYFGGNPWFISTLALAESYHYGAKEFVKQGRIKVKARSLAFFQDLNVPSGRRLRAGMMITKSDPLFAEVIRAMHAKADGYIQRVRYHADRKDGSWSEQFDRDTGFKLSAEKLTWNSAEFVRVLDNRREAPDLDLTAGPASAELGKPFRQALSRVHFAVEGAGDVVRRYWGPAIKRLKEAYPDREVAVTFLDSSEFWSGDPVIAPKMRAIIESFKSWGAGYFDKAPYKNDKPGLAAALKALKADAVIVANPDFAHVSTVLDWLKIYGEEPPQIFVEKPLDASAEAAFMLLGELSGREDQVHAVDHFRAGALLDREKMARAMRHLGGKLDLFRFFLVEDHSGADPHYQSMISEDGAIEREGRVKALAQGLIYDLDSHGFSIGDQFFEIGAAVIQWITAAQYTGVGGDPDARTRIPAETYADVGFTFRDRQGRPVRAEFVVGKGLRGVRELGPDFDHDVFAAELVGANGNKVLMNLRPEGPGSGLARLLEADGAGGWRETGSFNLNRDPYYTMVESIFNGTYMTNRMFMPVSQAYLMLELMDRIRVPIKRHDGPLATYPGGMRDGSRAAPYVEDLGGIAPLWGSRDSTVAAP